VLSHIYVRMPIYIDGVRINDREAWLEHKKLRRELILNSRLVRGGYRKDCAELNKCLTQVACAFPHPRQ